MITKQCPKCLKTAGFNDEQIDFLQRFECPKDFPDETPEDIAKRVMEHLIEEYRLALSFLDK